MKRVMFLVAALLVLVLPLTVGAQIGANRDLEGSFWNPTQEQYDAWRVINDVEDGATITFWPWALNGFEEYLDQVVANFEATYPGVTVTYEIQPAAGARDNIRNSFAAGNPPDVINLSDSWVAEFAEQGVLMNIDEALGEAYPDIYAEYVPGALEKAAFDGTAFHLPWYLALSNVLAYNGLILEELGYTVEDLPTTNEELYAFAQRVREDSDGAYYAISFPWGELAGLGVVNTFFGEGVDIFNEDRTEVAFNTPEALGVLEAFKTMLDNDYIPRTSLTDDVREMVDRFSEGDTLLLQTGPQLFRLINENNPEVFENLGLAQGIVGAANITNIGGVQTVVVAGSTPFPNAALAFATYLTSADAQTAFSQEVDIYSSNLRSYEDPFFTTVTGDTLAAQLRPLAGDYFRNATVINLAFPNLGQVEQVVIGEFQAVMLGVKTPQEGLDAMVTRINDILATAEAALAS